MSKRNGRNKVRLENLEAINKIDKRMRKKKIREDEDQMRTLQSKRDTLRNKLTLVLKIHTNNLHEMKYLKFHRL